MIEIGENEGGWNPGHKRVEVETVAAWDYKREPTRPPVARAEYFASYVAGPNR